MPRPKRAVPRSRVTCGGFASIVLLASACQDQSSSGSVFERPPAPVRTALALAKAVPVYLDEIGRCTPHAFVNVVPQVTGWILVRHFEDGADVKKGDLLFTIDPRPFEADMARAEAAVLQSKTLVEGARIELERVETVVKSGNAGAARKQEVDSKKNDVAVAEARLAASEAERTLASLRLGYCRIPSPLDARAGERLVDAENVVKEDETVLVALRQLDPIYVDFTVTERDFGRVRRRAERGALRIEARIPGEELVASEGHLTFIDSVVRDGSGTVKLRSTYGNAERKLWPGQFVEVRLVLETKKAAVLVPAVAIQHNQSGPFAFVVEPMDTAELRPVVLGQRHGDPVVIESGVGAGERVIVDGQPGVMPGCCSPCSSCT